MKLVSFRVDGKNSYGVVVDAGVVEASARTVDRFPSLTNVIKEDALKTMQELEDAPVDYRLDAIEFRLPVPNPGKIMCAGRNYRAYHEVAEEGKTPRYPSIFGRFVDSFAPHGEAIIKPKAGEQLDYEGELVAVVGKRGRHVAQEDALEHVAGYTIMNEGTVRDWMAMGTQNAPAKNFYRCGAIGPWLVTADEIDDPMNLHILTRRNGQVVQDGSTELMIFDLPYLIAHISKFTWLEPGDLIATGSPGGSIVDSDNPRWLSANDVVSVEIAGIGILSNPVATE